LFPPTAKRKIARAAPWVVVVVEDEVEVEVVDDEEVVEGTMVVDVELACDQESMSEGTHTHNSLPP
jgi:hypothetical protein